MSRNRIFNAGNPYQNHDRHKRVLCVCSAGLLRSPTAAVVLSQPPYNFNTRAAGIDVGHALIPVDSVLLHWADEIVCMESGQQQRLIRMLDEAGVPHAYRPDVICLNIEDSHGYRDPTLIRAIKAAYPKDRITEVCRRHFSGSWRFPIPKDEYPCTCGIDEPEIETS